MKRVALLASILLAGCTCSGAGPTAGGATPYVRCAMREPGAVDRQLGALHLRVADRVLTIEGAPSPLRIAAFRGAALADEPIEPALDPIESSGVALSIVLGSLGDDEARIERLLAAVATLATPTVVVLGGRDHPHAVDRALAGLSDDARAHVVEASGVRRIVIGAVEFIPVAGAPDGRYARDDEACGLGASDVDAIVHDLGAAHGARYLVGFAAPAPLAGLEGGEAGSALVADLATRIGAHGGLFAWPDVASRGDVIIVPPLAGPPTLLVDGSRLGPGVVIVEISDSGLRVVP